MSRFFIDRPIFAWVLAIITMLVGLLALRTLPVAQYPQIAPPQIAISASYPGASAQTMQDTVTQVLEQQLKGLDGLMYMNSSSNSNGRSSIRLTFTSDTDPDTAQVQVQNKLAGGLAKLPQDVQRAGVSVDKSTSDTLMVVALVSDDGSFSGVELGDFAESNLVDTLSRVSGVGSVDVFGSKFAIRIWLDPQKLQSFSLTPSDVIAAVQVQNAQVSAGQLGGLPYVEGQALNATVSSQGLLQSPQEFEQIVLRSNLDGATVFLKDVATIEQGSESYTSMARFDGAPSSGMGFSLAPGANALDTAKAIKAQLAELEKTFPAGISAVISFDTTPFVEVSVKGVVITLIEAVVLVFLVMYLFLQNLRATLIPTLAIPVVLLGTFGILAALGYSINTLTLFGLVLAIGLLVDDAIVVVENVERIMQEEGLSPLEATRKSMDQISGALVGIGVVISAVLIPMAFFGGSTGVIYRQFSVTIVSAMALSVFVALIFTPALCATFIKPFAPEPENPSALQRFFRSFNAWFDRITTGYVSSVHYVVRRSIRMMGIYALMIVATLWLFDRLPSAFLPEEDQGVLMVQVTLPAGATQSRTLAVLDEVEAHFNNNESNNVDSIFTIAGFGFGSSGQNVGMGFIRLKDWSDRKGEADTAQAIAERAAGPLMQIKDAMAFAIAPPAIRGMGSSTGFEMHLQDRAGLGHEALTEAKFQFLGLASQDSRLTGVRPSGQDDTPQLRVHIDHIKAEALGVSMAEVNNTLAAAWGGRYINDYLDRGTVKKVYVQGNADSRMVPEDLDKWFVRNKSGEMVPYSAFASMKWELGPPNLSRFNGVPSVQFQGSAVKGVSSGEAMAIVEEIVAQLPEGFGIEWSGQSYQERQSGSQAPFLFAISILVVFLCLAALYESWSIPFSVVLVVPAGILGALLAASGRGLSNDVFFQVGLLVTMGLSAKNAIMIVEFARDLMNQGMSATQASLEACRMRLRPILMTSIAFGLGVLPLAIATGAGSGSQNSIGTGVLGGTIAATSIGLFLIPLLFVVVQQLLGSKKTRNP